MKLKDNSSSELLNVAEFSQRAFPFCFKGDLFETFHQEWKMLALGKLFNKQQHKLATKGPFRENPIPWPETKKPWPIPCRFRRFHQWSNLVSFGGIAFPMGKKLIHRHRQVLRLRSARSTTYSLPMVYQKPLCRTTGHNSHLLDLRNTARTIQLYISDSSLLIQSNS